MFAPRRFGLLVLVLSTFLLAVGCVSRTQHPQATQAKRPVSSPDSLQLVRDLARPWGISWIEVEGVSLCVGLNGTGSDPAPSTERSMMISEMQVREVENADAVLASPSTALCMVRAILPPGVQKGERIDVEVRIPNKSQTTSLHGGWLMLTRLREYAKLNNRLSSGHVMGMCQGDVLVDSLIEGSDDPVLKTRGRILGGGVVTKSRDIGLRLRNENLSVKTSARIGHAINQRFHVYANGNKTGVATPKRDSFVQLAVHPRYRNNLPRYVRVIENIPVREKSSELVSRLHALKPRLLDPPTASDAAVQLEAIGPDAIPILIQGLESANAEIRFYASEALAYMDQEDAASALSQAIRREPAFRWRAFQALAAMDHPAAQEELALLLHEDSAETRYGAFRTLRRLSPDNPLVKGETVGEQFQLHLVDSTTDTTLVHVSKDERPEVVIFGDDPSLRAPVMLFAGPRISIRSTDDGQVRVKRLSSDDDDEQRVVAAELSTVMRAVVEMGGKYTDVVAVIGQAKNNSCLSCKVAYSAIAKPGRKYNRSRDFSLRSYADDTPIVGPTPTAAPPQLPPGDTKSDSSADSASRVEFDGSLSPNRLPSRAVSSPAMDKVEIIEDEDLDGLILFDVDDVEQTDLLPADAAAPERAVVIDKIGP